ncbi:hypothetical protein CABS03_07254 [Colletotrichum abscissum]|uniref:Clr5 domain-containing protein n=1 Tax=Colletotrichum abscissum TaxID=1671311 RepID=A0A9P9X497_9PEZI|nr:hypothetical protein CABS02_12787 [Colletotrichum abscissum]
MSHRQRHPVISEAEWERVRSVIQRLYLQQDMALTFVLTALRTMHKFHASKAQLEWKLKEWHMFKNMSAQQWKCVDVRVRERLSRGKRTSLYLSGIPLRPAAVEKARARHCHTSIVERFKPRKNFRLLMSRRWIKHDYDGSPMLCPLTECFPAMPTPSLPGDFPLIIRTPSPIKEARYSCTIQNLPWLQCQQLLSGMFAL